MKLTPWFSGKQKPVRVGVYMVDQSWPDSEIQPQAVYAYWDGTYWYPQATYAHLAVDLICHGPSKYPFRQWRGVMK